MNSKNHLDVASEQVMLLANVLSIASIRDQLSCFSGLWFGQPKAFDLALYVIVSSARS